VSIRNIRPAADRIAGGSDRDRDREDRETRPKPWRGRRFTSVSQCTRAERALSPRPRTRNEGPHPPASHVLVRRERPRPMSSATGRRRRGGRTDIAACPEGNRRDRRIGQTMESGRGAMDRPGDVGDITWRARRPRARISEGQTSAANVLRHATEQDGNPDHHRVPRKS